MVWLNLFRKKHPPEKLTNKKWLAALKPQLDALMAEFGFKVYSSPKPVGTERCYVREHIADGNDTINSAITFNSIARSFSFCIGIRFDKLVDFLIPEHVADKSHPLIVMPVHFLNDDKTFFMWTLTDLTQIPQIIREIRKYLQLAEDRFFTPFATMEAVEKHLRETSDYRFCGYVRKSELLAGISYLHGNTRQAQKILCAAIANSKNSKPAPQKTLRSLYLRMFGETYHSEQEAKRSNHV